MRSKRRRHIDRETARGLRPGSGAHYTSYVGPPDEYDLMGAMQFRLLATLGLREFHSVLDFGCGSLRLGRLLIPFLEPGKYVGLEPNTWLVKDAIRNELGKDAVSLKKPRFFDHDDFDASRCGGPFDFAIAQSIFSHSGLDVMEKALGTMREVMTPSGLILFNAHVPSVERPAFTGSGWVYPRVVSHDPADVTNLLDRLGLHGRQLGWFHRSLQWYIAATDPEQIPDPRFDAQMSGATFRVEKYRDSVAEPGA
jgi:SAM-dependent methyltransferase